MLSSPTIPTSTKLSSPQAVLRLTALWAIVESGVGGVLHAFRLPLTGLVVGGTAVVLITLIAHFAERPREILRATLVVLIIKALVSPHSPLGAYLAVGFQGVLGTAMYTLGRPGYATAIPFAVLAMLESAVQKLLMLTLFFGTPLREAVDQWGQWLIRRYFAAYEGAEWSLTWTLVGIYLGAYFLGGLLIGWLAGRVVPYVRGQLAQEVPLSHEITLLPEEVQPIRPRRSKRSRKLRRLGWWLLIAVALGASVYLGDTSRTPAAEAVSYLVRTIAIVLMWYFLVGPWLVSKLRRWLVGKQSQYAEELEEVMEVVPTLRRIAGGEFTRLSAKHRGFRLYWQWLQRVLVLSLTATVDEPAHEQVVK